MSYTMRTACPACGSDEMNDNEWSATLAFADRLVIVHLRCMFVLDPDTPIGEMLLESLVMVVGGRSEPDPAMNEWLMTGPHNLAQFRDYARDLSFDPEQLGFPVPGRS